MHEVQATVARCCCASSRDLALDADRLQQIRFGAPTASYILCIGLCQSGKSHDIATVTWQAAFMFDRTPVMRTRVTDEIRSWLRHRNVPYHTTRPHATNASASTLASRTAVAGGGSCAGVQTG
jgi:hypothetical protein